MRAPEEETMTRTPELEINDWEFGSRNLDTVINGLVRKAAAVLSTDLGNVGRTGRYVC